MKYLLSIFCFILCSCLPEGEESVNPSNKPDEPIQFEPCPSPELLGSDEPDPLILECPPEDIAKCPIHDGDRWWQPIFSVEELSFGKQREVRCLTLSHFLDLHVGDMKKNGCIDESILVSDSINDPPQFIGVNWFKSLICPWFTATGVSMRVVHISVDKNETGKEREMRIFVEGGNSSNAFTITQSAE